MATNEELIKKIELLEKRIKAYEEKPDVDSDAGQEQLKNAIRLLEIEQAQNLALGERNAAIQKAFEMQEKLNGLKEEAALKTTRVEELRKRGIENLNETEKKEIEQYDRAVEYRKLLAEQIKKVEKLTKGHKKMSEEQKAAFKEGNSQFGSLALKIGLNNSGMNNFLSKITKLGEMARSKDGLQALKKAAADTLSPQKMGMALIATLWKYTKALSLAVDKATAAFAANTGAGRVMTSEIMAVGGGFRNLGIDAEGAGKAAQTLFHNFTGFMQITSAGRKDLMLTVASLEKMGVSGDTAAKTLNLLTNNFGLSTREASKMSKELAIVGTTMGISSDKMISGFNEASKSLAVYGKDAIKVFTDLAAQAKAAGVEASALLGIAEKFDTFEGAADAVGKLNSILGTQMSATEMLTMKENERIETLIRSIQTQGIAFKDLDRFSQKAIASAAGISDMSEAQRIFGMSINDYRKDLKKSASEEEFNKNLKDTMDIIKKLEMAAKNFAIQAAPLIDALAVLAQKFLDWSQSMSGTPAIVLGVMAGLVFMGLVLAKLMPLLQLFGVTAPAASAGFSGLGASLGRAAGGLMKGAVAMLVLAGALGIIFLSMALFTGGAGGPTGGMAMFGFLAGLAGGILLLAAAVGILGIFVPFIVAGAAALAILGTGLAALGLGLMFVNLEKIRAVADALMAIRDLSVSTGVSVIADLGDFTDALVESEAILKPMLGDLAILATGTTVQKINTAKADYDFSTFSQNFENIFKPQVNVQIGDKEFESYIVEVAGGRSGG